MQMCNTWSHARTNGKVTPMTHASVKMPLNVLKMAHHHPIPSKITTSLICTPRKMGIKGTRTLSCLSAYEISKQPAEKYLYKYPETSAVPQQVIHAVTHGAVNPLFNSWTIKKISQGGRRRKRPFCLYH